MSRNPSLWLNAEDLRSDYLKLHLLNAESEVFSLRFIQAGIHNCPAYFFIAFPVDGGAAPAWSTGWQAAGGRGFTRDSAKRAAAFEAIERACLITEGSADPRVIEAPEPAARCFGVRELTNYSAEQMTAAQAKGNYTAISDCGNSVDNLWISGRPLDEGSEVFLSATAVLFGEDARLGLGSMFSTSTGAALRDTIAGAERHAVWELVERDAVAAWWYNGLPMPRVPAEVVSDVLPINLSQWLGGRARGTYWLALATDLPGHAVVAISARRDGTRPAIGAAYGLERAGALCAATLEMLQGEIALGHMRAAQEGDDPPPVPPLLKWSDATNVFDVGYLRGTEEAPLRPDTTHEALVAALLRASIDVYFADLTRPEFQIPVVKAVSPQLRDWHPQFGPGRLYDLPVALGLQSGPKSQDALNPIPFVI